MRLKLDMTKAYDRMEWNFLDESLCDFGFHENFIKWIKECFSSISFSILLNGSFFEIFIHREVLDKVTRFPLTCLS